MRLFIAWTIPETWRTPLTAAVTAWRPIAEATGAQLRWTPPDQWHLTLKFLGECAPARLPEVTEAVRASTVGAIPADLHVDGPGAFPERGAPTVIWVGLQNPDGRLSERVRALEEQLAPQGFAREARPFQAHITVARVQAAGRPGQLRAGLNAWQLPVLPPARLDAVDVMQSVLTGNGVEYTRLERVNIRRRDQP